MARLVSASATEPVTLAEVKAYAKVETADEDSIITALISSCRAEFEANLSMALRTQVWEDFLDQWPLMKERARPVWAPRIPLSAIAIDVADLAAVYTPWSDYTFRGDVGRVVPMSTPPSPGIKYDGIKFTFTSTVTTIEPAIKQALLDLIAFRYDHRSDADAPKFPAAVLAQIEPFRVFNV